MSEVYIVSSGKEVVVRTDVNDQIGLEKTLQDNLKFAHRKLVALRGRIPTCNYANIEDQDGLADKLYATLIVYDERWEVRVYHGSVIDARFDTEHYADWYEDRSRADQHIKAFIDPSELLNLPIALKDTPPLHEGRAVLTVKWLQVRRDNGSIAEGCIPTKFIT